MTEKLYDQDAYLSSFTATVTACRAHGEGYAVVLDRTAFFPEGGGQSGDSGSIGPVTVRDTQEENGELLHLTDAPCEVGVNRHLISYHKTVFFSRAFAGIFAFFRILPTYLVFVCLSGTREIGMLDKRGVL